MCSLSAQNGHEICTKSLCLPLTPGIPGNLRCFEPHTSISDFEMEMMDDFILHPGNLSPSNSSNSF